MLRPGAGREQRLHAHRVEVGGAAEGGSHPHRPVIFESHSTGAYEPAFSIGSHHPETSAFQRKSRALDDQRVPVVTDQIDTFGLRAVLKPGTGSCGIVALVRQGDSITRDRLDHHLGIRPALHSNHRIRIRNHHQTTREMYADHRRFGLIEPGRTHRTVGHRRDGNEARSSERHRGRRNRRNRRN